MPNPTTFTPPLGSDPLGSRRKLFDNFSWTIRQGERWVLRGPNGSGKTTLMALITGDSPLAYANDVKVFGQPREPGHELHAIRRRIGLAQTLLISTDHSATRIATMVGYDNTNYFNSLFTRIVGTTPIQYRKKYLEALRGERNQM